MKQNVRRAVLRLRNIVVRRGAFTLAIDNLELRQGEIACVVGPNGCGKTTLLLTVLGLLPHEGDCIIQGAHYDGTDPTLKASIGYIPDDPTLLFEELTAHEQWSVTASVLSSLHIGPRREHLMRRAEALATAISFDPPSQLIRDYSHGMRKKTQIVNALLSEPCVLVVDELRNGLDPLAIRQTEALVRRERDRGAAVLAATHDLWWAERFADYIYVMNKGSVAAAGTFKQLLKKDEPDLETAFYRILGGKP